jgi:hypothetical protein
MKIKISNVPPELLYFTRLTCTIVVSFMTSYMIAHALLFNDGLLVTTLSLFVGILVLVLWALLLLPEENKKEPLKKVKKP